MKEVKVIDEKSLQLVVTSETIGSLTTNAEQIRDFVKSRISEYSLDNYNENNIAQAKEDKAKLNKAKKALNDKRIELEKSFMQPFNGFKEIVTETVNLINDAVKGIDSVVKKSEQKAKDEKREQIEKIAEELGVEQAGIKLDLIFDSKWLNKSTSLKKVKEEITAKLAAINSDLETLKTFAEDYDVLVVRYKESLDLKKTVVYANQLKAQREASKAAEEEKPQPKAEEAPAPATAQQPLTAKEEAKNSPHVISDADDAFAAALGQDVETPATKIFEITATEEDISKVVDFLEENNITFQIK